MSQHDMTLDNASGLGFRTDANNALQALASLSSGAAAPSPTFPCQIWADTATGRLKRRNAANSNWVDMGPLDSALRDAASQGEFVADTGAANAYVCNFMPAITVRSESTPLRFKAVNGNSGACTINDGVGTVALVGGAHSALQGGEIIANGVAWIQWNASIGGGSYVLLFCTGSAEQIVNASKGQHAVPLAQSQALPASIQGVAASVASNALTLGWTAQPLLFRNPALTNGAPVSVTPTANLSLVVPSTATLGTVSGQQAQLVLIVAYNSGIPVLCVANLSGGLDLSETGVISPTTIGAGANSSGVIYSASAVAANSPYRVVGYIQITEATAGTWATAPTLVQGAGGQALSSLQSLGYGQVWQTVTRTASTAYYNTTGRPIALFVVQSPNTNLSMTIGGVTLPSYGAGPTESSSHTFIIPAGQAYSYVGTISGASELR